MDNAQPHWESVLRRIDKILEFDEEPRQQAAMLHVVTKRFIRAFDEGGPESDKEFWERMVHELSGGSPSPYISGWITRFCAWNTKGEFFAARKYQNMSSARAPEWVI
ncbi:hypothetical protein DXG01_005153 [Tephrocybe rancida]|nr:hypothetical protein DXG01_005153 [Tephrocybe rancida]